MKHNQDFISHGKAMDRLISALHTHTHTDTHMTTQRPFGITDICDTLDTILSPNEHQKAAV